MTVESGGCGADKPVDVGDGTICASFSASGAWLSLGTAHPIHGFVELSNLPAFDESLRGNATATRRYREWMTQERFAFLSLRTADGPIPPLALDCSDPVRPRWHGADAGLEIQADAHAETGVGIVQRWRLRRTAPTPHVLEVAVSGRLDRPALAEITELDPPPPTGALTELRLEGDRLALRADALPAAASITLTAGSEVEWHVDGERATARLPLDGELELNVACDLPGAYRVAAAGPAPPSAARGTRLVARAVAYVRACTALAVGDGERTILTDHRILPLSWTRDAYYQALLLLATGDAGDADRVAEHLRWLWLRCERPDGRWVRSHHADGRRKDLAFQADQQLYPILELADFWTAAGRLPELPAGDWTGLVREAWDAALVERDPALGCMATVENAADDPAAAPYICASQILLWYAASRLADLSEAGPLELDGAELRQLAESVRAAVARHFVVEGPFGPQWAYAVDGAGGAELYHDANDLPVALAPVWGFCSAADPVWRATMRFAFAGHNPGFFAGAPYPGLGSLHTPGPWTLGDVQAWLFARLTDDAPSAAAALARLEAVAFGDGMLPEAYAGDDPERRVRHWFAWPGAVLAALLVLDERGELAVAGGGGHRS